jgi:hypothetical protein
MDYHRRLWRTLAVLLAALVLLVVSSPPRIRPQAQDAPPPIDDPLRGVIHKVLLRAGDDVSRQALLAGGARLVADYGAFSLWLVDGGEVIALQAVGDGVSVHPEFDRLLLRETRIDTTAGGRQPGAAAQAGSGRQLYVVQFVGPVRDEWLEDLAATGARIVAYVPYNGYVVWTDEAARAQIAQRVSSRVEYQWHGPYRPAYRLAGALQRLDEGESVDVAVQVLDHAEGERTVQAILAHAEAVLQEPFPMLEYVNLVVRLPAALLPELASVADVFDVEPWRAPVLLDERQGQIMAGYLTPDGSQPAGPGYRSFLSAMGFSQNPNDYPIVDVIDDGFDNGNATTPGHADFYRLGSFATSSRIAYARDLTPYGDPRGISGHGTLNVSIVGGYNRIDNNVYEDDAKYQYGLGISPYGRMASSKVFNDDGDWVFLGSIPDLIASSYNLGARITSNSWGGEAIYYPDDYTFESQAFDALTRDADADTPGNQQMAHVVSAGNEGDVPRAVNIPGTAKNVITVGASENVREEGTDDCFGDESADDAQDMAIFSSRGPTDDGRIKPDIVAPGTRIQGAASQTSGYTGSGVCNKYWPSDQQLYKLYTWSSGTSHATPAIAGALSLIDHYLRLQLGQPAPSPAMLKAYLLNSARYLTGDGAGSTLPSNDQGWGIASLDTAFDGVPRLLVDQGVVLHETGQTFALKGVVVNPSEPFRVTLAWTDAPGTLTALAWVNDLDLEVSVGGQTYKGNVFAGASSIPGGSADDKNNVEGVFLPAGVSGSFVITVTAANIPGNGVPGNLDATDQDFALVAYNAVDEPDFTLGASPPYGQVCAGGDITYTVSLTGLYGYDRLVSLAHSAPPPDGGLTVSPGSGTPSFDAALQVTTSISTTPGVYAVVVTGSEGLTRKRAATVTLAVDAVAPTGTLTLISPTHGITNVAQRPLFSWTPVTGARVYRLQVAGDETFASTVIDTLVDGASYQPGADLYKDRVYHWRVTAQNGCGGVTSTAQVFTTVNPVSVFFDPMEEDAGIWTAETASGTGWMRTDRLYHSPSHAWYKASDDEIADARLVLASPIAVEETSVLSFWYWYDMESAGTVAYDGGVLEISVDGGDWDDLGSHIVAGGYGHTVWEGLGNPLAGPPARSAWSGNSDGWVRVEVDLSSYTGSLVRIRFRWGGDSSDDNAPFGGWFWYVDDVRITVLYPPFEHRLYLPLALRNH